MSKYLVFALLALAVGGAVEAAGGVAAFMTQQTRIAGACASVGC
jgi:hypothetical protein